MPVWLVARRVLHMCTLQDAALLRQVPWAHLMMNIISYTHEDIMAGQLLRFQVGPHSQQPALKSASTQRCQRCVSRCVDRFAYLIACYEVIVHVLSCRNIRFLERLLADWAPIEHVWTETGETPLLKAISRRDLDVSRVSTRVLACFQHVPTRLCVGCLAAHAMGHWPMSRRTHQQRLLCCCLQLYRVM